VDGRHGYGGGVQRVYFKTESSFWNKPLFCNYIVSIHGHF